MEQVKPESSSALSPLLNALLREWDSWEFVDARQTGLFRPQAAVLRLNFPASRAAVLVEARHRSKVGYHDLAMPLWRLDTSNEGADGEATEIDLFSLLALILADPDIAGRATAKSRLTFLRRSLASIAAIADATAARGSSRPFSEGDPDFIDAESALRFGHAVHPAPMSREEFTHTDSARFGHEYCNAFKLRWWAVDPTILTGGSVEPLDVTEMVRGLAASDPQLLARAGKQQGKVLVPMHPWQAVRLMLEDRVERLFRAGRIVDVGLGGPAWRATTSLRTVHSSEAEWMLKFSLSLRLTNSRRIVEEHECRRGLSVHRLVKGKLGYALQRRCPTMTVLGEPAWFGLRDEDGRLMTDTIVSFRENPFRGTGNPPAAVLGALCERHPGRTESHLSDLVHRIARDEKRPVEETARLWFERFLHAAIEPFIVAFSEFGLLFGAHQQNLVVGLAGGWPNALYFRDCQGTGYVEEFLPRLREFVPEAGQAGDHVFPAEAAAKLFGYYLVVNGAFAAVAALAAAGLTNEDDLLAIFRRSLERLAATPMADRSCVDYLLNAPTLAAKGNFLIALRDINENTEVTDPLAGYVELPNPLHVREYA
ncbi:IucA/IucC family protein [Mesorhizobium sp. C416B]|uniref:IucA/IucC family protein n=1 Tax=unclassified Mesorhizobium TaxID=325217 RepID=UPI0004CF8012|nr:MULTISPECIES: IucA/IucC family protein [unclassified Mesorhizobium]WJI60947.1 IucA/IucC family protein [Mesorhizobium sp. C416B]